MILPDTIQLVKDTSVVLPMDSLVKIDSLALVDSLRLVDSIKSIIPIPTGFIGIPHPSLPQTEGWVFGVLLFFFLLITYSISQYASLMTDSMKSFFQVKQRSSIFSKATINDLRFRFFIIVSSIGVVSFYLYLFLNQNYIEFSFLKFGSFFSITALFFLLKSFSFDLLGYIFLDYAKLKMAKESYFNILSYTGIVLFPLLILRIYILSELIQIIDIISLIVIVIAFVLIVIKLFQIFFHKIVVSFYIMLYLCTLEFLPLVALYLVYQFIL